VSNLEIYNQLKTVPEEAKKKITGGRLNGMTDIKPMWRIEKLTEIFGMCGIGWKTSIKNKEIIDGANGEKIAIVDIELYVKVNDQWSEPIEGTGGSSFISNEKNGLYTSDECFKMAYTDALSVACKSLGMGADVYWGDSKYNTLTIENKEDAIKFATSYTFKGGKHANMTLKEIIDNNDKSFMQWLLGNTKTSENVKQTITLLTGLTIPSEEEQKEIMELITKIQDLSFEKNIDLEEVKTKFKVDSITDMTIEQMKKCINAMEKKGN
jgi:hypothetical protein